MIVNGNRTFLVASDVQVARHPARRAKPSTIIDDDSSGSITVQRSGVHGEQAGGQSHGTDHE
jgi:hypothetical protein